MFLQNFERQDFSIYLYATDWSYIFIHTYMYSIMHGLSKNCFICLLSLVILLKLKIEQFRYGYQCAERTNFLHCLCEYIRISVCVRYRPLLIIGVGRLTWLFLPPPSH